MVFGILFLTNAAASPKGYAALSICVFSMFVAMYFAGAWRVVTYLLRSSK